VVPFQVRLRDPEQGDGQVARDLRAFGYSSCRAKTVLPPPEPMSRILGEPAGSSAR
jgi:hypothetical protein